MSRVLVDSGIGYLGNIPSEWNIFRIKNAFKCKKNIVNDNWSNTQLLSLTTSGVKEKDIDNPNGKLPDSFDGYQYVEKNNIIMCLFDLDCSAVFSGISKYNGMISPAYKVLECKEMMNPDYSGYYFNYISFDRKYMHYSKNIRYTLNYDEFSSLPMLIPPLEEQRKIAEYLDKQCAKIDEIISDNNREIELLEEYKRRIIFEKTSLGTITKVKNIGYVNGRIGFKGYSNEDIVDEDTPGRALSIGGTNIMKSGTLSYNKRTYISEEKYLESPEIMLTGGEILMTKVGAGCGENSIYEFYEERVTINPNVMILHVNDNVNSKYINYCLLNDEVRSNIKIESMSGGAQPAINQELLKNLKIKLPSKSEQDNNTDFLDKQCSKLDSVVEYRKQIIEKLEEYKRSLIYECVTGKREV